MNITADPPSRYCQCVRGTLVHVTRTQCTPCYCYPIVQSIQIQHGPVMAGVHTERVTLWKERGVAYCYGNTHHMYLSVAANSNRLRQSATHVIVSSDLRPRPHTITQ